MDSEVNKKSFGKYQILEELGRGGFGIVYKALDQHLDREVALKVLYPNLVNDSNFVTRFRQEARIAAKLDHPNLVPVHDFGQQDGNYYIAMGYMAGGSLKELLQKQGKLEPQAAYEILEQVGAALSYAHGRGIIHRDLKPGNILLDENGKARVADMGFAKVMSEGASRSMSASGSLIGTPAYMAPETWRNKPATAQTDIYSLGCILYEMLTGKVLFEGESPAEIMTMHMIDGPQYKPKLPEELRALLDKALKRNPEERYPEVRSILANFKSVMGVKPEPAVPKPIKTVLGGHTKEVTSVAWSPDGKRLVSGSKDYDIILWYVGSGERLRTLEGHRWYVNSVAWAPNGRQIASGSADKTIILWDPNSGARLRTLEGHMDAITCLAWSPDGKRLASGSSDTTIIIWNEHSGERLGTLEGPNRARMSNAEVFPGVVTCVAWSPDGRRLASGIMDGTINLWSTEIGARPLQRSFNQDLFWVLCVAWSPDGKRLASGSIENFIVLWDADTGVRLRTLEGHTGAVSCVAWSSNGRTLASGSWDDTIILWDEISGARLRTLEAHTKGVQSVTWSPDGRWLASAGFDGTIRLWGIP